jgi:hypothetical protein
MLINNVLASRFINTFTVNNWYEMTHTAIYSLNAGDYVTVMPFDAQTQWMSGGRADHNRFQGYLIG